MPSRAVFFMSDFRRNDLYNNWLNPFLISYFRSNKIPLLCVYAGLKPTDEKKIWRRIENLPKKRFDGEFGLYNDWDTFDWCTQLGYKYAKGRHRPLSGFGKRILRKLSVFLQSDYDEVLYLDIDSVVLKNLEPLFDYLSEFDIGFGHTAPKEWVYNESSDLKAILGRDVPFYNCGIMVFRKGLLTREMLAETVRFGCEKDLFHPWKGNDQPIVNLAVMKYGLKHIHMKSAISGRDVTYGQISDELTDKAFVVHWAGSKLNAGPLPNIGLLRHFDPDFSPGAESFHARMLQKLQWKAETLPGIPHYFLGRS